jgi:hypothetical protein
MGTMMAASTFFDLFLFLANHTIDFFVFFQS